MLDYPLLRNTLREWESSAELHREHLDRILSLVRQREMDASHLSDKSRKLALQTEIAGVIHSSAERHMKVGGKNRKVVEKTHLNPWLSKANKELNGTEFGLKSTASGLQKGRQSIDEFSRFSREAEENQKENAGRTAKCKRGFAELKLKIQRIQEDFEAWDEV